MTYTRRTAKQEIQEPAGVIEELMREHYPYIRRLALSILDDPHDAEDVAQETFIAAHRSLEKFRGEAVPKTWLTAIAVNACRGKLRKRRLQQVLVRSLHALHLLKKTPASLEQDAVQADTDRDVWEAIDGLDEKHRLPVILRYVHEMEVAQIAKLLNLSQGTVHSRLHYARLKLYQQLGHLNPRMENTDDA